MKKLWGENFFNAKTKKWGKTKTDDNVRSFCQFVLDPIYKMFDAIMNFKKEETDKLLDKLDLKSKLKYEELQQEGNFWQIWIFARFLEWWTTQTCTENNVSMTNSLTDLFFRIWIFAPKIDWI